VSKHTYVSKINSDDGLAFSNPEARMNGDCSSRPGTLSIAMCTFNGAIYLRQQLESFLLQTRKPDELVVCDDGSTDNTIEILETFGMEAPFPVRVFRNEKNLGFNENFIQCVTLCCGEYIAMSDQDDVWYPEKIELIHQSLSGDPSLMAVIHPLLCTEADLTPTDLIIPHLRKTGKLHHQEQELLFTINGMAIAFRAAYVQPFVARQRTLSRWTRGFAPFDEWILFLASIQGLTLHHPKPLSLYRRHSQAVTGDPVVSFNAKFQFGLAMNANSDAYAYLSEVAASRAETSRRFLEEMPSLARQFCAELPAFYDRIERIYIHRAAMYDECRKLRRLAYCTQILKEGGYRSRYAGGLGWKALVKDLYKAIRS
jgi:glycosyltransferase involved in cell wall biosynthesis